MTEKRFTCHQMIADYSTGEDIDFDFLQELIDEQKQPKDLRMHISDGNKIITYRECVDLLNNLVKENEQLERGLNSVSHNWALMYEEAKNKVEELKEKNEKIKRQRDSYYRRLQKIIKVANGNWE